MILRNLNRGENRSFAVWLALGFLLSLGSCSDKPETDYDPRQVVHTFLDYKDTLITLGTVREFLSTDLQSQYIGSPIGVAGTSFWLVPLGGWTMEHRARTVQGTYSNSKDSASPRPIRCVRTVFHGPFDGVLSFNAMNKEFMWVMKGESLDSLIYVRSSSFHFLVTIDSESELKLKEIVSGSEFVYHSKGSIISWDVVAAEDLLLLSELVDREMITTRMELANLRTNE